MAVFGARCGAGWLPAPSSESCFPSMGEVVYPEPDMRFEYIVPQLEETARRHEQVGLAFREFARTLDALIPAGTDGVAAFDLLEETAQKAHQAVARDAVIRPL